MAKVAFSKLSLKKKGDVKEVMIGDNLIEVKQYLPIDDKLNLITRVVIGAHDGQNNFSNPIKVEVLGTLEIIMAYTNITFTDKQKEDISKLYDLLEENGIIDILIDAIPSKEYDFLITGINDTIDAVYTYQNSVLGILESVKEDYSNLDLDAENIREKLGNNEGIELLAEIMNKELPKNN